MYFLRFSEAIIKVRGENALQNDWYEYVEYGTNNKKVIWLQKHGFMREQALQLLKQPLLLYLKEIDGEILIDSDILEVAKGDVLVSIETVRINYPEIFV